jgi:hypothetical protein
VNGPWTKATFSKTTGNTPAPPAWASKPLPVGPGRSPGRRLAPDEEVARRIGRTVHAVRLRRICLGIPDPGGHGWTAAEVALLGVAPDAERAGKIGRTPGAVTQKRCLLGPHLPRPGFREARA